MSKVVIVGLIRVINRKIREIKRNLKSKYPHFPVMRTTLQLLKMARVSVLK